MSKIAGNGVCKSVRACQEIKNAKWHKMPKSTKAHVKILKL